MKLHFVTLRRTKDNQLECTSKDRAKKLWHICDPSLNRDYHFIEKNSFKKFKSMCNTTLF